MREYLKNLRTSKGLSQQTVADGLSISQQYYNFIENGERQQNMSLTILNKLSTVFGIPANELIKLETEYTDTV